MKESSPSPQSVKLDRLTRWRDNLRLRGTHELNQEKYVIDEQAAALMDELAATIVEQVPPGEIIQAVEDYKKGQRKGIRVLYMTENSNTLATLERRAPIEAMIKLGLSKGLITPEEERMLTLQVANLTG